MQSYPHLFKVPQCPYTWNNENEDINIAHSEAPMHLLFLGHCKSLFKLLFSFLKKRFQETNFRSAITHSKILTKIEGWNLSWCLALDLGNGKFGGFISENYLALTRLIPWLCDVMEKTSFDQSVDVEKPDPKCLTTAQVKHWLRRRGALITGEEGRSLLVSTMYQVLDDIDDHEISNEYASCTIKQMIRVMQVFFVLVSRLMNDEKPDYDRRATDLVIELVKFYLSSYKIVENAMDGNSKDSWTTKPNMLGLFNLVNTMPDLGPPRALWEGGRKGEGLIQDIKPHIHGLRNNWMYNTMKRVAQDKSFNVIADCDSFRGEHTGRKESDTCDSNLFASYASV